jgi:hypothetical protein
MKRLHVWVSIQLEPGNTTFHFLRLGVPLADVVWFLVANSLLA